MFRWLRALAPLAVYLGFSFLLPHSGSHSYDTCKHMQKHFPLHKRNKLSKKGLAKFSCNSIRWNYFILMFTFPFFQGSFSFWAFESPRTILLLTLHLGVSNSPISSIILYAYISYLSCISILLRPNPYIKLYIYMWISDSIFINTLGCPQSSFTILWK